MTFTTYLNSADPVDITLLTPSVGAADDEYGACIDVDGDWLVIGAPMADPAAGSAAGRVFIWKKTAGVWAESQIIEGTVAGDEFGCQVAISGDKMAIGWLRSGSIVAGAGTVYTYTLSGGTWVFESELVPATSLSGKGGTYGSRIHMDGDVVIIGMPSALAGQTGFAFAFHWSGSAWVEKSLPLPATIGANDAFGSSVSVSETGLRCVIGAPEDDDNGTDAGAAYVYEYSGSAWVEIQKIKPTTSPGSTDYFGKSVGISKDGDTIAVGAYGWDGPVSASGCVYVFEESGGTWGEVAQCLQNPSVNIAQEAQMGICAINASWDGEGQKRILLSDNGSVVLVGCPLDDQRGGDAGSVYYFTRGVDGWAVGFSSAILNPNYTGAGHQFGGGCALDDENTFIVAALDEDGVAADSGQVFLIEGINLPWEGVSVDTTPPTFAGVTAGVATSHDTVELSFDAATDDVTATDAIWYEVHIGTSPGAAFTVRRAVVATEVLPVDWGLIEGAIPCTLEVDMLQAERTYYFRVRARDEASNLDTNVAEVAVTMPVATTNVPVVTNISPAPDTEIATTTIVQFSVTDAIDTGGPAGFRRLIVHVHFGDGTEEIVHNGDNWGHRYGGASARTAVIGGYTFTLQRAGGWKSNPTFYVYGIDKDGNESGPVVI
jgi:hypothetical protein